MTTPKIIDEVSEVMARHGKCCAECGGTGYVKPSELFSMMCKIANGKSPKWVMCLKCFGVGEVPNGL